MITTRTISWSSVSATIHSRLSTPGPPVLIVSTQYHPDCPPVGDPPLLNGEYIFSSRLPTNTSYWVSHHIILQVLRGFGVTEMMIMAIQHYMLVGFASVEVNGGKRILMTIKTGSR